MGFFGDIDAHARGFAQAVADGGKKQEGEEDHRAAVALAKQQEDRRLQQRDAQPEQAQQAGHQPVNGEKTGAVILIMLQHVGRIVGVEAGLDDVDGCRQPQRAGIDGIFAQPHQVSQHHGIGVGVEPAQHGQRCQRQGEMADLLHKGTVDLPGEMHVETAALQPQAP